MNLEARRDTDNPPLLALAMIVRDGGQFLDSLLGAARDHVDEIVVVDTGSRDGSPEVARRHGARVLDFPWCDDFAAARNASLDACRADWILCLDADEQLAPGDWAAIRRTAAAGRAGEGGAGLVVTRNYIAQPWSRRDWQPVPAADPHALPGYPGGVAAGFVPTAKVRLFPNRPLVRFRGRLHETVEASLAELGVPVTPLPVVVHHFGMLHEDPAKAVRYLALARRKADEQPQDAAAWRELSDCALVTGDHGLALAATERSLALEPDNADARLTAGWMLKEAGALARAEAHLLAVSRCPGATDAQLGQACHLRAQLAILDGRCDAAGPLLTAALSLAPGDGNIHNTLGVWHLASGRGEPARAALERAAVLLPHLTSPCLNLARMYEAAGHPDLAARQYERAVRRDPTQPAATEALARLQAHA